MIAHRNVSLFAFAAVLLCGSIVLAIGLYALVACRQAAASYLVVASIPYLTVAARGVRGRIAASSGVVVGVGAALAIVESANIILEEFFSLRPPANAIVPASAMGAAILAAAVSAVVLSSSRGAREGIVASVFAVGMGMLVSCALALSLIVATLPPDSAQASAVLARAVSNASMHLIMPLIGAALVGAVAAFCVTPNRQAGVLAVMSLGGSVLLLGGIFLLVRAASLPRPERPALVMPGMLLSALGLTLFPTFLARHRSRFPAK